ncbi:RNA 3'-terminal phosphate cyclase [Stenotrophomonas sp. STM01]|uniref:RNA 3'-terminal phosphate cyclase n=1 Tax=Stenotrophomonas sp. STM01 TaxID=2769278 RepID=UPI00177D63CB|nr:RNA 3'-terminal phosphate cyclase [Stenotrophomonas sp. STM01]MBD9536014.1 RNA 3'-terminal phosphate cyclase [Stenotrophomonas sp. STM01]
MDMIEIDGSQGGGQLLRSALSLSLCTRTGFTLQGIRAMRRRPGLMRQHLTAVTAAARVGNARVEGATLGATTLRFEPGEVQAGDYHFAIGSAGSATLVLQTLLPALWQAPAPSRIRVEGGTHNPLAPSADFLDRCYLPALARLGVQAQLQLQRHGFFPAGGGELELEVQPCTGLSACAFEQRGPLQAMEASVLVSGLAAAIGQRELDVLGRRLGVDTHPRHLQVVRPALGPGNVAAVTVRHGAHVELFDGHGERGLSAEQVGMRLADAVQAYLQGEACVGEHLSDQLLLPMALAGGGSFSTGQISAHLHSNARLIEKFLPVAFDWQPEGAHWRVNVLQ